MSCMEAPWKPERTKQRWAAARISARRSDWACALARRIDCGSPGSRDAVNESERSLSIWATAWHFNVFALRLPGCVIELTQAPKGSTARHYFDMGRLRRRDAEFNWYHKGF